MLSCNESVESENKTKESEWQNSKAIKLDDSTKILTTRILSYQHNFNLNLLKKIRDKGLKRSLDYCNIDKLSKDINSNFTKVQRIAFNSIADANLIKTEDKFLKYKFQSKPFIPIDTLGYLYYPIVITQTMCLSCHGTPYLDIEAKQYQILQEKYKKTNPSYKMNDIIGYWKINQ